MPLRVSRLRIGPAVVRAEVATGPIALGLGLMFRRRLAPDAGMLLDLRFTANHALHMWGVRIPLDILFLRPDGTIARIVGARPGQWPFRAGSPVRYALEVNAGWCRRHGVRAGARVRGLTRTR